MAATVFMFDGTDATQDLSAFVPVTTGTGVVSSATDQSFTGPRSLKLFTGSSAGNAQFNKSGILSDAGTRISVRMRFDVLPSPNSLILRLNTPQSQASLVLNSSGVLTLTPFGLSGVNGTAVLSVNTWHRIAVSYVISSTTVWRYKVYVDSVLDIDINSTGTLSRIGTTRLDLCAAPGFGNNASVWFDDLYIDNGSDYADPGDIRVTSKRPVANGTTNGFTTQIGAGGSGYGSGHAPQVNEQPLSATNGWSMVGAGAAVTEEYTIEGAAVGDVDISPFVLVDYMGWLFAKSLASETAQIKVGGSASNISLTSTSTYFFKIKGSATYPAGGTDIGIVTATDLTTVSLYEAGVLFAYKMIAPGAATMSASGTMAGTGRAIVTGTGTMAATGTLAGVGRATATTRSTMAATGAVAAVGRSTFTGTGTLAAQVTMAATGQTVIAATASFSVTAVLAAAGQSIASSTATMAAAASLVAAGRATATATAAMAASGTIAGAGRSTATGTGTLAANGTLAATGAATATGTAAMIATGTMQALPVGGGIVAAAATMTATATMVGSGKAIAVGTAAMAATASLAAVGRAVKATAATMAATGTCLAVGRATATGTASLAATAALSGAGRATAAAAATMAAQATLAAGGQMVQAAAATMAAQATMAVTGRTVLTAAATMAASAVLASVGRATATGSGSTSVTAVLAAVGRSTAQASMTAGVIGMLVGSGSNAAAIISAMLHIHSTGRVEILTWLKGRIEPDETATLIADQPERGTVVEESME